MPTDTEICAAIFAWITGKPTQMVEPNLPFVWRDTGGPLVPIERWAYYEKRPHHLVRVPDYFHDEAASASLLDEVAEKGYGCRVEHGPGEPTTLVEFWLNYDDENGGGTHTKFFVGEDADRKRAIGLAALEASKNA